MKERAQERVEYLHADESVKRSVADLSATGAALIYQKELKKGTRIRMKIKDQEIDAVVVYCRQHATDYRVGLQFMNMAGSVQNLIKNMVDEFSRGVPLTCEILEQPDTKKV